MPHNYIFTMTETPETKIHCLFEPGTDVRFNYERYGKEEGKVDSILTEKCKLYDFTSIMSVTAHDGNSVITFEETVTQRLYGSIEVLGNITTNIEYTGFDQRNSGGVGFNIEVLCRGRLGYYGDNPCGDIQRNDQGVGKNIFHDSSYGDDYPTINSTTYTISDAETGETVAEGGADKETTGKVCKLQPEQSIDINTIVPLLSGIEVKGSVELPTMPENCIEIWRYIQGVPPTQMKVKRLCSEEGCPPPEYTVDCEPCCPPGLIEVECGDSICCYNKQGEAVKQCP